MQLIVGVIGFIDSGKGTVGNILVDQHGFNPESFAKPVKDCVAIMFDWPRELLEGDTKESREFREKIDPWWTTKLGYEVTPRKMLQLFGTECIRDVIDQDMWIMQLERRLEDRPYVITDVRFPNEIEMIKNSGGYLIWVKRGELPEWYDTALDGNYLKKIRIGEHPMNYTYPEIHESEYAWIGSPVDFIIENNGTLEDLNTNINNTLEELYLRVMLGE
jgi:hypothetical protein